MNERVEAWGVGGLRAVVVALIVGTAAAAMPAHAAVRVDAPPVARSGDARTTFRFNNIPVRSALRLLAEEGRFNLVVSDSVEGTISLHLVDVTWEQALDVVLKLKGLEQRVQGNTRSVAIASD